MPSFESARIYGRSNLRTGRDGLRVLRALLKERLNTRGTRLLPDVAVLDDQRLRTVPLSGAGTVLASTLDRLPSVPRILRRAAS